MIFRFLLALQFAATCSPAATKLSALIVDGMNNHDWAAGTRAIQATLESSGRFTVEVCTWPKRPEFRGHDVVINNFNGGHTAAGTRWPREVEQALVDYVRGGGGLVVFHAANNAFLEWPEYNDMIGLGWRDRSFGPGIAIGPDGALVSVNKGSGLNPGHGPRHDFDVFVREPNHVITRGLPEHWQHPSEQLTHGQHGPAQALTILTYAFSEISHQGEPMDWVREYGRGRIYTTMLGHTWKDELNPNLDDLNFQTLLARGTEWAATGAVTLAANLGWRPLFNGKDLEGWEPRGDCVWTVMPGGALLGTRTAGAKPPTNEKDFRSWQGTQAWLYTKAEFNEFDLHVEYWVPPRGNSGVSIRDRSRAHTAIGEPDSVRPDLTGFPKSSPAHIGYEIQILDYDDTNSTGSIYGLAPSKTGVHRSGLWNSMDIESRTGMIRVRVNGQIVAEGSGDPARPKTGPIGLQLHDRFTTVMFRNVRIREW